MESCWVLEEEEPAFFRGVATGGLTMLLWVVQTHANIGRANWIQWGVRKEERETAERERERR